MHKLKKSYSLYLAAAIAVAVAPVIPVTAQSEVLPARGPIPFTVYDKNHDNIISEDEFNSIRAERIKARVEEGRMMRGAANAPSFSSFDLNDDGALSSEELAFGQKAQMDKRRNMGKGAGMGAGRGMMQPNMPTFSDFDLNGDGKLLEKEFYDARAQRINERAKQGYMMRNIAHAPSFSMIDIDGDGVISPEEFAVQQNMQRQKQQK